MRYTVKDSLIEYIAGRKVLLVGFGREGQSSLRWIRSMFPHLPIGIADKNPAIESHPLLVEDSTIHIHSGEAYLSALNLYDLVIKSPGIRFEEAIRSTYRGEISSQSDLFLRFFHKQVIGITGTKGKSTTTHLLYEVLKNQFGDVFLAGNMGIPFFDIIDDIKAASLIVCEFSSHQLEQIHCSPHIAVCLNLFEEHLDYYSSFEKYAKAKMNIARFSGEDDFFIYCKDEEVLTSFVQEMDTNAQVYTYSMKERLNKGCFLFEQQICFCEKEKEEVLFDLNQPYQLEGRHNLSNMLCVSLVAHVLGVSKEVIRESFSHFQTLAHRLERVGEFGGIRFYNDSISTIPQATIEALIALKEVDTLILGGFDRGIDYAPLCAFLDENPVRNLVFVGEAGKRIASLLRHNPFLALFENEYKNIVDFSFQHTRKGKICLLSPAASSYDQFKNFEERGNYFKSLIKEHPTES